MEKVVFPFEYGINAAYPMAPVGLLAMALVAFLLVEYSSQGSFTKKLDFVGRYAALLWPALAVSFVFMIFVATEVDEAQNDRDEISLQKGFDEVLAGENLKPEDKVEINETVTYAEFTDGDTEAITLTVGSIEMVGNEDEDTMSLTFYPEDEEAR